LRRHPQQVRAAAILGVSPPAVKILLPMPKGVKEALDHIFADCAADEKCRAAYPNLPADFAALLKQFNKGSVRLTAINPFTRKPQQISLERSSFNEHLRTMLYQPDISRWLPMLIHQGAEGDFELFASIGYQTFRGLDDAIARGMHFSVVCGEDVRFITDEEAAHSAGDSFYGAGRLKAYRRTCEMWPSAKVAADFTSPVKSPVPVLLISGEADPVTPPWAAEEAFKYLSNSRHLIVPRTGHYFNFSCVNRLISEFISRGSIADLDASCLAQIRRPAFVTEETLRVMAGGPLPANRQAAEGTEESWQGVLDTGRAKLRLVLRLGKTSDGKWAAKMDSPDQGRNGLPIDEISLKDQTLYFEMNLIGAAYQGMLNPDKAEIRGEWRQQGRIWPLVFKRVDQAAK
jgi:pimeloyl-ACP methyl ester carboxylesterase